MSKDLVSFLIEEEWKQPTSTGLCYVPYRTGAMLSKMENFPNRNKWKKQGANQWLCYKTLKNFKRKYIHIFLQIP